jgi:squalene/oxidosqualene cyclase-like protein
MLPLGLCAVESPSTMFGTTMNYVALRLLGMGADHPVCRDGRTFIREQGGAVMTSSWAKFALCMLGCMHWDGHNSVPPGTCEAMSLIVVGFPALSYKKLNRPFPKEMWLLPNWFPFHPGRMWCHARMVYLPMGYIYGCRLVYQNAETDPVVLALRSELYCQPYESIDWTRTRHWVAPMDDYSPIHPVMRFAQNVLAWYELSSIVRPLREWVRSLGIRFCAEYMAAEDLQTNFIDIGPVNKVFNMIAAYHLAGGDLSHTTVSNHMARVADYLWLAEDGMKMKGYNGSQCWDTSFAIQAIYEAKLLDDFPDLSTRVWRYLERTQILSTDESQATAAFKFESASNRRKYFRHISQGGWPFSTSAHGWPISDCTSEGLKGALCLIKSSRAVQSGLQSGALNPIGEKRLQSAVNVLLTYQNEDGGWATYENNRGYGWYEALNPSEVFGDIMIDYSYVECSMATLTALSDFHEAYPKHRTEAIRHSMTKGCEFLKSVQREDGSWYGSWACCFTYGCWFGVEGLVKCGEPLQSPCIVKACAFLLSHQRPNGGWGEDFTSCYDKDYARNGMEMYGDDGSGVVNTAWALLALSAAHCDDVKAIKRGLRYLMDRQLPFGDWPQEGIAGVFNRACGITYTAYRNIFPIWALGRCREVYGSALDA